MVFRHLNTIMSHILKISDAASIGMHAMGYLSHIYPGSATVPEIAKVLSSSANHLSKVLQRLEKSHLVKGVRGPKGGFTLAREPAGIRLLDVYEALEGRIADPFCLLDTTVCDGKSCILGDWIKEIPERFREHLSKTDMSDVAKFFAKEKTS